MTFINKYVPFSDMIQWTGSNEVDWNIYLSGLEISSGWKQPEVDWQSWTVIPLTVAANEDGSATFIRTYSDSGTEEVGSLQQGDWMNVAGALTEVGPYQRANDSTVYFSWKLDYHVIDGVNFHQQFISIDELINQS